MTITRHAIENREQWLDLRRKDVTGSEVGALFGVHRYLTPAALYAEKIGALPDDKVTTGPMSRGVKLEGFVATQLEDRHSGWKIIKADQYFRDGMHHIGGTPDCYLWDKVGEQHKILEIKTVGASDFRAIWKNGDPEAEPVPEPWQILQCLTYQYLTGARGGIIAVMVVGEWEPMDIYEIEVPYNEALIYAILQRVDRFWLDVHAGVAPAFDFTQDLPVVKALYASAVPGHQIDLRGDDEMQRLLDLREQAKATIGNLEKSVQEYDARIRTKIGDAESALVTGWKSVTLKNQHRHGYTVAATDFRVLRATREK